MWPYVVILLEIGLHVQNKLTILGSIAITIARTYVIMSRE